jgi:glycosyltransferase involved in cell wall biosynthesis
VGEDTLNGRIQAQAQAAGLEGSVRFHGFLEQDRLRPLMLAADLLLVTSRHEGGPIVLAEAAASGVPTVGTAVGQIAEWAPAAAIAAPVGDAEAFAREVRALLEDEPRRLRTAALAGERAVAEDADWTAHRVSSIYQEVTNA